MKKLHPKMHALMLIVSISHLCHGQQQQYSDYLPVFRNYVFSIVEDTTNFWSEYPKPPKVTDGVLFGMQKEIMSDDTVKNYLEQLSFIKYKGAVDSENAFFHINKMDYGYSLLALTAHWEPGIRVTALVHLKEKLSISPMVNSSMMKNGEWRKFDKIAVEFLVYLLESNPLFISGSENATIHSYYISNILWNLDLLTGENIVEKKNFRDWYKNDLQFQTALLKWKSHIK